MPWVRKITTDIQNKLTVWETLLDLCLWSDDADQITRCFYILWNGGAHSVVCARNMDELMQLVDMEGDPARAAFCELRPHFQLTQRVESEPLSITMDGDAEDGVVDSNGMPTFIPITLWYLYQSDHATLSELIGENPEMVAVATVNAPAKPPTKTRNKAYRDRREYLVKYRRMNKERLLKYREKRMKQPAVKKQVALYKAMNREALKAQEQKYYDQTKQWRDPVKAATQALNRAKRACKPSWFIELLQLRLDTAKETLALKLTKRKYNKRYNRLHSQKMHRKKIEKKEAAALLQTIAASTNLS